MSDDASPSPTECPQSERISSLLLDPKDVICPICTEIFVFPRSYDCGHAICELCMHEMDRRDTTADTHTLSIHNCPICRFPTLKPWYHRPRAIALEQITSQHPDYEKRKEEVTVLLAEYKSTIPIVPKNTDLANLAYFARCKLALELYEVLVERVYTAALDGLNFVSITEPGLVGDIEKVVDLLSKRLFRDHNVYKVLVTRAECTIYLSKDAFTWRRQHENPSWLDPNPSSSAANDTRFGTRLLNTSLTRLMSSIASSRAAENTRDELLPEEPSISDSD